MLDVLERTETPKSIHEATQSTHAVQGLRGLMAAALIAVSALNPGCKGHNLGESIGVQVAAAKENGGALQHNGLRFRNDNAMAASHKKSKVIKHVPSNTNQGQDTEISASMACPADIPIAVQVAVDMVERECVKGKKMNLGTVRRYTDTYEMPEGYGLDVKFTGTTGCESIMITCDFDPTTSVQNSFRNSLGGNDNEY